MKKIFGGPNNYEPYMLYSRSTASGVEFDDSYNAYIEDESLGSVRIAYDENTKSYVVRGSFENTGDTELVLVSPDGEETVYDLKVENYSYEISRRDG